MKLFGVLYLFALVGAPLHAQVDLVGEWVAGGAFQRPGG